MIIKFLPNDAGSPIGKLADAELEFTGGPLDGLKLVGFAVWERKNGARNVTFPARQYSINGERRSYALLRPTVDVHANDRLRDLIIEAYAQYEQEKAPCEYDGTLDMNDARAVRPDLFDDGAVTR